MRICHRWMLLCAALASAAQAQEQEQQENLGYYRWPALRAETVVFAAEGDLWRVAISGGTAQRLTTHAAEESMPAISPDGRWLAFVASYDAGPEVYVMPLAGGAPRRLSFDAARVLVQGFSASGELLYGSDGVSGPSWSRQLRGVDPVSGVTRVLPLIDATEGVLSADGNSLWFTRFGLQVTTDNARAYRGGAMAQLWHTDLESETEAQRLLPQWDGNLRRPLLGTDRLYVISDASGSDNLWSMALDGSDARQLTQHRDYQVRSASLDGQTLVYALGANLRVLDLSSGKDRALPIHLSGDREAQRQRLVKKPLAYLSSASISANGERAALNLRGQVHLAGIGALRRIRIATEPAARLRSPVLSHDGQTLYAIRDLDGRSEVLAYPADGRAGARVLTKDGSTHRWRLYLSPDGNWLAHDDKQGRLWLLDLSNGNNRLLDRAEFGPDQPYRDVVWSPDSQWLVLVRPDSTVQREQLLLIARSGGAAQVLTSDRYPSFAPAFSADGRWLYFLSQRHLVVSPGSPWGDRNTGPFLDRRTKVYALALQDEGSRFPFLPADELASSTTPKVQPGGADQSTSKPPATPSVQAKGLAQRLFEVPLSAGNYTALAIDAERLYLLDRDAASDAKPVLKTVPISDQPAVANVYLSDVQSFAVSQDGKKLYVQRIGADGAPSELLLLPAGAKAPDDTSKLQIKLGDNVLAVSPAEEWRQIFDDAWRMHAAFAFDDRLRAVDWNAVRARYAPLLARLGDRSELDDLLAQMIAELGLLHSQVRPGELRVDSENSVDAFLGADWLEGTDPEEGLEVRRLWATEVELPSERGPLQASGVDVQPGDRLRTVNGRAVHSVAQLSEALLNQAGQQTLLEFQRGAAASRRFVVTPVNAERESALRYGDWVQRTRETVRSAGDGQIGYLHLRAMGGNDMAGFVREFYANFDRPALIIDVRRNRGGNIDSWVLDKLLRRTWSYWHPPGRQPYWNMPQTFRGHLVVLADALTYSDGETFAAGVQALGLAPVIGVRTAGAGIWLSDRNRLVDNGVARIAEYGQFDAEGRWLIEGSGVAPDIEVENPPRASAAGQDAQLAAAIAHLQQRLQASPIRMPATEAIPAVGTPAARRAAKLQ